jgi:HAD superfamily hydrolase (TIGR01549 family)
MEEKLKIEKFYKYRVDSEQESRIISNNNETNLDFIYAKLNDKLIEKEIDFKLEIIKRLELNLEKRFLIQNPFMKSIYDYCIKNKKQIFFISDMYLPSDFIRKVLVSSGYDQFKLYVSCDYMLTKASGDLFEYVMKDNNINPDRWLHIGDNYISDFVNPKKIGLCAYYYHHESSSDDFNAPITSISDSIIRGIQRNFVYGVEHIDYWTKFGYLYASPIYYGFTNWLYKYTNRFNNIYFLARDGYIPKKIFDLFLKKFGNDKQTIYLYCSRATFQIASIIDEYKENAIPFLIGLTNETNNKITINDVLKSVNLNSQDYEDVFPLFNIKNSNMLINYQNYSQFEKFLSYIYVDIRKSVIKKRERILAYLKQEKVPDNIDDMCIVDVGWGGSIQNSMKFLLNHDIFGFYFGTNTSRYKDMYYSSLGYMYDRDNPLDLKNAISSQVMMYEFLFSAPHGTTLDFKTSNGKVIPILDENEKNNDALLKIEEASLTICNEYLKYYEYLKNYDKRDAIKRYDYFINRHDYVDMQYFSNITNSVIYHNKKESYVKIYKKSDIIRQIRKSQFFDVEKFETEISTAMWRYAFYIRGVNSSEITKFMQYIYYNSVHGTTKLNMSTIGKALKNPKKAINVILKKMK